LKLHVLHRTSYHYASAASYSIQVLKLTPRRETIQRAIHWRLSTPGRRIEQLDAFGNIGHLLTLEGGHQEVTIIAEGLVETMDDADGFLPHDGVLSPLAFVNATVLTGANAAIAELSAKSFDGQRATPTNVSRLAAAVANRVTYRPGTTLVSDSAIDVIQRGEGVCQDQAHVAIAACRAAGIPARYVSGYVHTDDDDAASHAWIDVWVADESRWFSWDITHQRPAGNAMCRLAVGRDYLDAAPVRGMRSGGGKEQLEVQVAVLHDAIGP
jgi:transglutaminase-like putative cysteine protease